GGRVRIPQVARFRADENATPALFSLAQPDQLRRVLEVLLDEDAFLSPYGLRSLSKRHDAEPFAIDVDGVVATVDYEPGESTSSIFGGNSNWRGPIWFPTNVAIIESLDRFHG